MLAVTPRFLAALRDSHAISVKATLYRPSLPTTPISVEVIDGSVSSDVDARVLRQANLEIAFSLDVGAEVIRELPFGGYCVLERGIRYADGTVERVQLGRFRVENVTWPELQGTAVLTLADRMAQIVDEAFTTPYAPSGLKPSDAIVDCVEAVFGTTIDYHVTTDPASESPLGDTVYDEDRAAAISNMAAGIDAEAYFDALGDFVLRPRPTELGAPVWTLDTGALGVLLGADESLDRSSVRNGVAVRATPDPAAPPIYALAVDDDPSSPTRWGGPFGKVPLIVNSTTAVTQADADATAARLLNLRLGLSRTLELRGVPNPALEPGDLIEIIHADGRSELQYVNALEIALDPTGELRLLTRANWRPEAIAAPSLVRVFRGDEALLEMARV
jgi:Domain of unknown function (DUF5047)